MRHVKAARRRGNDRRMRDTGEAAPRAAGCGRRSIFGLRPKARLSAPGSVREGVAGLDVAALQAGGQPLLALRRRAVGEAVGHGVAARGGLQPVVADRLGGRQRPLDVALFQDLPLVVGVVRPYPGKAVGLQLDPDRKRVGLGLARPAASCCRPCRGCRAGPGRDGRSRARPRRRRQTRRRRRICSSCRGRRRCRDRPSCRSGNRTAPSPTARRRIPTGSRRHR